MIPAALAAVVEGLSPLNDFHPQPLHTAPRPARFDAASGRAKPAITVNDPNGGYELFVTPADASIIYDTPNKDYNPAATQTLDGSGVTIGIVGYSKLMMSDVQNYRTAFVPTAAASNLPKPVLDGGIDPGVMPGGYGVESLLDVEIAGGLAPGAAIQYYYAASTDLADGLTLASLRALEDNQVNILSVSYGQCEQDLGPAGNLVWSELWEQAAAQGISVTVSTGDNGSASCDATSANPTEATQGLSVSGLASTPYNIAVGGTDYYSLADNFSQYVNVASKGVYPYYATSLGYIPENPWNDSSTVVGQSFTLNQPAVNGVGETNIVAGGGGISRSAVCNGYLVDPNTCSQDLSGYPQPPFQTNLQSAYPVRSLPDVSLLSGNGFYGASWIFCSDSVTDQGGGVYTDCQVDAQGHLIDGENLAGVGGTSAAAPAFAAMLAMISQSQGGVRLGQANNVLYNLAADSNPDPSQPGKYQRAFHDVTIGNNSVVCGTHTLDCGSNNFLSGYDATPSYDLASGLGSVDLSQLVNLWSTASFTSTGSTLAGGTTSDSLSAAPISVAHGTPLYFSMTVAPGDATGQFSLLTTSSSRAASYSDFASLDTSGSGNVMLQTNDLPGGSYTVHAYYDGDTTHAASTSNDIPVLITPEASTTALSFGAYNPTSGAISEGVSSLPYGTPTYANAQPFGNASTPAYTGDLQADGLPTGNVTFTFNGTTQTSAINSLGYAQLPLYTFLPGTYRFQASYAGDVSFTASTSNVQTLTITKAPTSVMLLSSATAVSQFSQIDLQATLQTQSVAGYPTGTLLASANGHTYPASSSTETAVNGVDAATFTFTIPAADLVAGSNSISVNYSGDANYLASSGSTSVTVLSSGGNFTLAGPDQPLTVEATQQTGTLVTVTPAGGFTGQINMSCVVSAAKSGHTPTCVAAPVTIYGNYTSTTPVQIATYQDTPAGSYTVTVSGQSGLQSAQVAIPMQVTAGPGFTLAATTAALGAAPGQGATDTLTVTPANGFTGVVALSCFVAPLPGSGQTPSCSVPTTVSVGAQPATATLQVATGSATPQGAYSITVTATSGLLQQVLVIPFSTQPSAPTAGMTVAPSQANVTVATVGQPITDALTIVPPAGFTGTVQLSCSVSGGPAATAMPTCSVPSTAAVSGGTAVTATLTVNTTAGTTASAALASPDERGRMERVAGLTLTCLLLCTLPRRRRKLASLFVLAMLLAGAAGLSGCGSAASSSSSGLTTGATRTAAGNYTVTVAVMSGSSSAKTQVNLTVQ